MDMKINKVSLRDQIADKIRKMIFQGQLAPEDKITEMELAREMDVSRGPVREAMQILVMEGLLVSTTYKETRVSTITAEEVVELLLPMRVKIETFALKKAYPLLEEKHYRKFEQVLEQMKRATAFDDLPLFNELDIQFHEFIIRSSKLRNIENIWEGIVHRIHLHLTYQHQLLPEWKSFTEDHRKLLAAFKTGNLQVASECLENHILQHVKYRPTLE